MMCRLPFIVSFFLIFSTLYAESAPRERNSPLPMETAHANWIFSGMVSNEKNERFGYFFQVQRDNSQFEAITALVEAESNALLFYEKSHATLKTPDRYKWQIGQAFLSFNPINESWVFGLKTNDKKGFNFKVDMLHHPEKIPIAQKLRPGLHMLVNLTGRLNGHIQLGSDKNDQFVTAKNTWFRQAWLSDIQTEAHPISSLLCRFYDGSGIYSVNLREKDACRGAVAGFCDPHGLPLEMSQFIDIKEQAPGSLAVQIPSPKLNFVLSDIIKQHAIAAGFFSEGTKSGFCTLSHDSLNDIESLG